MPRYTFVAMVSFESLTTALLIACKVAVYLLTLLHASSNESGPLAGSHTFAPPMQLSATCFAHQCWIMTLRRKVTSVSKPRSTALYLTKSGPVLSAM